MIDGKIFAKFQKLLPKMNAGLKKRHRAPNAFFAADEKGCITTDGLGMLYAPALDACENAVALTDLPKVKFGAAVFIEPGEREAGIKDGALSASVPQDETGKAALLDKMRELFVHAAPAYDAPANITVDAGLLRNLLDGFDGLIQIEIANPNGEQSRRRLYIHDVSSGADLLAMLLPVYRAK